MRWNPQFICLMLQSEIGKGVEVLYNIILSLPEIDPSDAAQSCDQKTRKNDKVRISAHKFSPSKIMKMCQGQGQGRTDLER